MLHSPGENSQSTRQFQFTDVQEILEKESIIKEYIYEAVEVEKTGLKVNLKKNMELVFPEEWRGSIKSILDIPKL